MDRDDIPEEALDAYRMKKAEWGWADRAKAKVAMTLMSAGLKLHPFGWGDFEEIAKDAAKSKFLGGFDPTDGAGVSNDNLDVDFDGMGMPSFSETLGEDAVDVNVEEPDGEDDA